MQVYFVVCGKINLLKLNKCDFFAKSCVIASSVKRNTVHTHILRANIKVKRRIKS